VRHDYFSNIISKHCTIQIFVIASMMMGPNEIFQNLFLEIRVISLIVLVRQIYRENKVLTSVFLT